MKIDSKTGQFVKTDLAGRQIGKLTAIEIVGKTSSGVNLWRCLCDCGNESIVSASHLLRSRPTKSCGCLKFNKGQNATHGLRKHPLYSVWRGIKYRCLNEKAPNYPDYGGRGITISDQWKDSFVNFYNDMSPGYERGLHIGRLDNDKGYCKENCEWQTPILNMNNKRSNVYVTYDGRTHTPAEWARELIAKADTIRARIRRGRPDYEALFGSSRDE